MVITVEEEEEEEEEEGEEEEEADVWRNARTAHAYTGKVRAARKGKVAENRCNVIRITWVERDD